MHCLCCASLWRPARVYDDGDGGKDVGAEEYDDGDDDDEADDKDNNATMMKQRNSMGAIVMCHGTSG